MPKPVLDHEPVNPLLPTPDTAGPLATRASRIEARLREAFPDAPVLVLRDDSAAHYGHAGALTGRGHYHLTLVHPTLAGLSAVARHRAVYGALGELMQTDIHALAMDARGI